MNKMKHKCVHYHLAALVISLFLAFISIRFLLLEDKSLIPEHRDITFPPYIINIFQQYFFTWSEFGSNASFENLARIWSRFLLIFSPNVAVFSRLIFYFYYFIMFFVPYISFFYILKDFLKYDGKSSFFTAIVVAFTYSFNPYVVQNFSPPQLYVLSYALLPALVFSLVTALENDKFPSKFLLSIVITLVITSVIRYIVHVSILMVVITLLHIIRFLKNKEFSIKNFVKKCFVVTVLLILLNLYWVLPVLVASGSKILRPSYILTYETIQMFSTSYKMTKIFTLSATWWPTLSLKPAPFLTKEIWDFLLYFIPLLSIGSLFLWKSFKEKEKFLALSTLLIYLTGISLWKGIDNPISLLSDLYSFCVFSINPSIGWMFRVPGYFGCLVVFATSLLLSLLLVKVTLRIQTLEKLSLRYLYASFIITVVFVSGIISWQIFSGNLDGVLGKGYYAEDFIGKFEKGTRFITLVISYDESLKPHRIGEPYLTLPSCLDKYLKVIGDGQLIAYVMQITNTKNILTDIKLDDIYFEKLPITICDLNVFRLKSFETCQIKPIHGLIFFDGNWQYFGSLSKITGSDKYGLTTEAFEKSSIILNPEKHELALLSKRVLFLVPFDFTVHHNPSRLWSKAMTNDPLHGEWHRYLEMKGIENWDFDYGKGLVFTWAISHLKMTPTPNIDDLIIHWTFNSLNDLYQWKNYTREKQFGAIHAITLDSGTLKAELWNSTWGWKTINSPFVEAEYGNWYRLELQVKAKNAHGIHVKIAEYDQNKKMINAKYVKNIGSGTFDWQTITVDYTPENSETRYIQLQIWHGHKTTQLLPNEIWVDNVKIYDLKRFTESATLEISFTISETNEYVFLTRLFQNQKGGKIEIQIDDQKYIISTEDQLNKFVWKLIDTLQLEEGSHKITLTNLEGFNAVNLFALIPKQEYQNVKNQIEQLLQDKRIIYILEAESDFYHKNSVLSNKYGGEASNGQILEIDRISRVWNTLEIVKPGKYTFAIRSRGELTIKIDEKEYQISMQRLNWAYIGPINLEKGNHMIEITNPTNQQSDLDVVWLYSTQNEDETLEDIFKSKEDKKEVISYQKIDPTKYLVRVNATKPFMLSFAESYDPLWFAYVNGEKIKSIPLYGMINGFWINQTGLLEITIEYEPQRWFYIGSMMSLTTIIACITYLVYDWAKKKVEAKVICKSAQTDNELLKGLLRKTLGLY